MKNKFGRIAATIGLTIAAVTASAISPANAARSNAGQDHQAISMRIYEQTRAPIGHVVFCRTYPDQCSETNVTEPRIPQLTEASWKQLVEVNDYVNLTVTPITDMDLYNTIELWTYPQGAGDCEDYVLEKQRQLVALGWPVEALLITVLRDENGAGHAVLTVTTNEGDFLLDNRYPIVRRWQDAPYEFRKRQSQYNPSEWVSLAPNGNLFSQMMLRPSDTSTTLSAR